MQRKKKLENYEDREKKNDQKNDNGRKKTKKRKSKMETGKEEFLMRNATECPIRSYCKVVMPYAYFANIKAINGI